MKDGRRKTEDGKADEKLDVAIDRAVREMLDVEPAADFRARVLAQLPASGSRPPASGFRLPAFGLPLVLGALAALLLVVALTWRTHTADEAPIRTAKAEDTNLPVPPVVPPITPPPTFPERPGTLPGATVARHDVGRTAAGRTFRSGAGDTTIAAASFAEPENSTIPIAPLKTIAPIEIASISPRGLTQDALAVKPLAPITDLQFAPITPPGGRN